VTDIIAEIHKKLTTGEDQLTGNFFGSLRYLPFDLGIKPILRESAFPTNLFSCLDGISLKDWDDKILFWEECRSDGTEPDVVVEFGDVVILIEVKLNSGEGKDQLKREAELLLNKYRHCSKKILLLLAPESYAKKIYDNNEEMVDKKGVSFGYTTWQKVLTALNGIDNTADPFQKTIINDLIRLLTRKGFDSFKCFDSCMPGVTADGYWKFNFPAFYFENHEKVTRCLYYEFK